MFVKLKKEDHYHFCREHVKELGKLDKLKTRNQLSNCRYAKPEDGKICEECQALAEKGGCTTIYVKIGSFVSEEKEVKNLEEIDRLDKIEELQELRERGAITEEEFEERKKEFL